MTPLPTTLPALLDSVLPHDEPGNGGAPAFPSRRGPSHRSERLRVKAFEMYVEGQRSLREIARELDCSHQYVYKLAKAEDWAARKTQMVVNALLDGGQSAKAIEVALTTLQTRLEARLVELEQLCHAKSPTVRLKAVVTWLEMAGVRKGVELPQGVKKVEVVNDFSDRRQVTVVSDPLPTRPLEEHDETNHPDA